MDTKLTIELVPKTCFFSNLRSELPRKKWDELRKECYKKAGYKCEICGGTGPKHPVECHEIWDYDDKNKTQTLDGLIALCPNCHEVKHFGLSITRGIGKKCLQHIAIVNEWSLDRAEEYVKNCFEEWEQRSRFNWTLDISWVDKNG